MAEIFEVNVELPLPLILLPLQPCLLTLHHHLLLTVAYSLLQNTQHVSTVRQAPTVYAFDAKHQHWQGDVALCLQAIMPCSNLCMLLRVQDAAQELYLLQCKASRGDACV